MNEGTSDRKQGRLPRRDVVRFLAGTGAMIATGGVEMARAQQPKKIDHAGYGSDPDLVKQYQAGDVWPLTMTEAERAATTALGDLILPADELGPAASALRVPEFIDEWVSAPYPEQAASRPVILDGLRWLDAEAARRHQRTFAKLSETEMGGICDEISELSKALPEKKKAAEFFVAFRSIAMGAYYCTPEGWKAIGYVGNVASVTFEGPPEDVLRKLGLVQTVKGKGD